MALFPETVAIPVTKGVDLRTAARLVEPPSLLEALNVTFGKQGAQKRQGHVPVRIRSGGYPAGVAQVQFDKPQLTPYGEKILDDNWLFGWGSLAAAQTTTTALQTSGYPEPGLTFGAASRDDELLAWTGHSLISYAPAQDHAGFMPQISNGVMPALRATRLAKRQAAQVEGDAADNLHIRTVVWREGTSIKYSVYDSQTGALIVNAGTVPGLVNPKKARVISLDKYFHIVVFEDDVDTLRVHSFFQDTPTVFTQRNLGDCKGNFDVFKVDETRAVVLRLTTTNIAQINWVGVLGTAPSDEVEGTFVTTEEFIVGAISVHPVTGRILLGFASPSGGSIPDSILAYVLNRDRTVVGSATLGAYENPEKPIRVAVAPVYNTIDSVSQREIFDVYVSQHTATFATTKTQRFRYHNSALASTVTKFHMFLASQAFRVGNRTFVWASIPSTLQSTWVLLDEALNPVGHMNFGVADAPTDVDAVTVIHPYLCGVNFRLYNTRKDQCVFQLVLAYKVRVETTSENTGLFTEPSLQYVELDFLPKLRFAQAGRATYFAGAQIHQYDGAEITEQGFHVCPEVTGVASAGGALTASQAYSYRVDLCYKNAAGEEIRSHSLLTPVSTGVGQGTITLTIKTCLTSRSNAYFLIFRNAIVAGVPTTTWNLINSRDPNDATFRTNTQSSATVTFIDAGAVTDSAGLQRELHPANVETYLHPFAGPACEIIAAGRDRLWAAGGELLPGQIAPSRLFPVEEAPAFNGNIIQQIDRNEQPVTAIGFVGDITAVFRERFTYVMEGDGPDNNAIGFWPPARLALSDSGAKSQEGVLNVANGLIFQGPAGFRLLGPSGGDTAPIGAAIDEIAADFEVNASVIIPLFSEARFYGADKTLVYNYLEGNWSVWSCAAMGAVPLLTGNSAALVTYDSWFWIESDEYYRDGFAPFEYKLRFPWMHAGSLGDFQRVKRIAGFGTWDTSASHKVRLELFYDEREFAEEIFEWSVPDTSQNTDAWGDEYYGAGVFGDTSSATSTSTLNTVSMALPINGGVWTAVLSGTVGKTLNVVLTDFVSAMDAEARENQRWSNADNDWVSSANTYGVVIYNVGSAFGTAELEALLEANFNIAVLSADPTGEDMAYTGDPTEYSGVFVASSPFNIPAIRDSVWRWQRGPRRQKCSVFSISVSDAASDGPGFAMSALGLTLAKKIGLDKIPAVQGGSNIYR